MNDRLLVAYATLHGSTREIAERIASQLRQAGLDVDVLPAGKVRSLQGYSAVVLGTALYMFRMHKDARRFMTRHQQAISGGIPLAIFAGGAYGPNAGADSVEIRTRLNQELAAYGWLHPVCVKIVGGRFDPARLHFPWNLVPALRNGQPSDARDWDDIAVWAAELPEALMVGAAAGRLPEAQVGS
jgi:menaquinone-dependent protoporphyrinogen oxidase